jgi:hypothetical protein
VVIDSEGAPVYVVILTRMLLSETGIADRYLQIAPAIYLECSACGEHSNQVDVPVFSCDLVLRTVEAAAHV